MGKSHARRGENDVSDTAVDGMHYELVAEDAATRTNHWYALWRSMHVTPRPAK